MFSMELSVTVLVVLGLATLSQCQLSPMSEKWMQWKQEHNKTYTRMAEEIKAYDVWLRHWHFVTSHNRRSDVTFTVELNQWADKEPRKKAGAVPHTSFSQQFVRISHGADKAAAPTSFDWRAKGVVSPVRNQGRLGNSEAFAVTDALESYHAINIGDLVALSVREVVDCCSAIHGMLVTDIYECIARHGGLCSEQGYPVQPSSHVCKNDSCTAVAKDANTTIHIPRNREDEMITAVLKRPIVVFVDASHSSFQLYQSGVYSDPDCTHTLDHTMLLVGYGELKGIPYWILKNSWGAAWGLKGYILMKRGVNMCGVADNVLYPQ